MVLRKAVGFLCVLGLLLTAARPVLAEPLRAAFFPFELDDTSLVGAVRGDQADQKRLVVLDAQLRSLLTQDGRYVAVDTAPVASAMKSLNFRTCNGCEVELAQKLGAQVSVIGWVQKVSDLILNINVVIRSVPDGRVLRGDSVDIRGDNDESWRRGLDYLVHDRLFPQAAAQ